LKRWRRLFAELNLPIDGAASHAVIGHGWPRVMAKSELRGAKSTLAN
jgi:hypothetical protein